MHASVPATSHNREEAAHIEIGLTVVSRGVAIFLTVVFLLIVSLPPAFQSVMEIRRGASPQFLKVLTFFPSAIEAYVSSTGNVWERLLKGNGTLMKEMHDFEHELEDASGIARTLRGPAQLLMSRWFGQGNEQVYVGRDGWLFFRPDFEYATGRGFLEDRQLHGRTLEANEYTAAPRPDPREAIIQFKEQLANRGIALVLVPAAGKLTVHPEYFSRRYVGEEEPIENPSFAQWKREMNDAGVHVFDAAPLLTERKRHEAQYLATDTHWTPAGMQMIAESLAAFLQERDLLPRSDREFVTGTLEEKSIGDIAAMMQLPKSQKLFPREKVLLRQIRSPDGSLWKPDQNSDVLLLGDSFTNIYSLKPMGWGEGAGFAEQLSFALHRGIDVIAQNDSGAYATRRALSRELAAGNDRLAGKRVVIWQFATRELAVGDWQLIPMALGKTARQDQERTDAAVVTATIKQSSGMVRPGTVPYREALASLHLVDIQSTSMNVPASAVVYLWGMRDNKWTAAATYKPGQRVRFRLTPWETVEKQYGSFNRIELDDPNFELIDLPTFWAETIDE
jgi:SGNH hydrolase-like domain, acetyltransferase AlgX